MYNWSQKFATQPEILAYLRKVAKDYGVYQHENFASGVGFVRMCIRLTLCDTKTGAERIAKANVFINGGGALREPSIPPKLATFEGPWCHSAMWKHDMEIKDKIVGVVGSGASAIQIVPRVAEQAKELYVFQRTPTWVVPRHNFQYSPFMKTLFKWVPGLQTFYRTAIFLRNELTFQAFKKSSAWNVVKKLSHAIGVSHLKDTVPDPAIRQQLTPNYEMGCKRIVVADDYFPAFMKENVRIVSDTILGVEGKTIKTTSRSVELDSLILATGFDLEESIYSSGLVGKHGKDLKEAWQGTPQAYLGVCTGGFPNAFFLLGPNTGLGHNSIIFMIECQVDYIMQAIKAMLTNNLAAIEVKEDIELAYNQKLEEDMQYTVFASNCGNWYTNKLGKVYALWTGNCLSYWRTLKFNFSDYFVSAR